MLKNIQIILKGLKNRHSFVRNITVFTSGTFIAYFTGFLFTPVITRIYSPSHYGQLAFINIVLSILLSISTLNYSEALLITKNKKDLTRLSSLILVISSIVGAVFTVFLVFNKAWLLNYFNVHDLNNYVYIIPVLLFFSIFQLLADNNSIIKKQFSLNSKAKVFSTILAKSTVTGIGLSYGSSIIGLLSGEIILRTVNYISIVRHKLISYPIDLMRMMKFKDLRLIALQFRKYPKFIFPASILLQISLYLPFFIIGNQFSAELLGYYSLSVTLIGIPVQIVGFSVGKVFLQKASTLMHSNDYETLRNKTEELFLIALLVALFCYGIFYLGGNWIITIIAGNNWVTAGKVVTLLSPALAMQLVATVIAPLFRLLKIEKKRLVSELLGGGIIVGALFIAIVQKPEFYNFVYVYSIAFFTKQLITIFILLKALRLRYIKYSLWLTLLLIISSIISITFILP